MNLSLIKKIFVRDMTEIKKGMKEAVYRSRW